MGWLAHWFQAEFFYILIKFLVIINTGIHSAKATALKKINDFRGPHKSPELVWGLEVR